jgi:rhomboid protease GluP
VWVTPTLVVVNIALFLGLVVSAQTPFPGFDDLIAWGADFGPKTMAGQWWRLITSAFLHLNPLHLAFNMWALWNVGRLVERMAGNIGFVLLYAVSAIGGNIASLAWHPHVVSGGASGAIFGICGALIAYVFTRKDTVPAEILSHLKSSMGGFLVYNIAFGFMVPGIDNAAHLGGLASGFVFGLLISQPIAVETMRSRPLRNALAAVVAGALLFAGVWMLPAAPIDVQAEFPKFAEAEERVLREHDELIGRAEAGELDDAALADEIENNILPQWRDLTRQVESWRTAPLVNPDYVRNLLEYMRLREETWQLVVKGARNQDKALIEQAQSKKSQAEEQLRKLGGSGE